MDEPFGQCDPAAQRSGQPSGLQVSFQQRQQLLGAAAA